MEAWNVTRKKEMEIFWGKEFDHSYGNMNTKGKWKTSGTEETKKMNETEES